MNQVLFSDGYKLIIGAGFYGLWAALFAGRRGQKTLVLECDEQPFMRASHINQARVHMGYHYPRSISTAWKTKDYFDRFNRDFGFCVNREFEQVYGISSHFSWTNSDEFEHFCDHSEIFFRPVHQEQYFKKGMCDGAFIAHEYTYDALLLKQWLLERISEQESVHLQCGVRLESIVNDGNTFIIRASGQDYASPFVLNATYASVNYVHRLAGFTPFDIKYELCEVILCDVSDPFENLGITVMDGPFFSIMPFGMTGQHSLTSVSFTPHWTSNDDLPRFDCQQQPGAECAPDHLGNCHRCPARPRSADSYMSQLARKYLRDEYAFDCVKSLYSMKAVLKTSEIDDGRPTVVRQMCQQPAFFSVLSGKISTVYDVEDILE